MSFRTRFQSVFLCSITLFFLIVILLFPAETAGGAASGLSLCLYTLIPATFPFVVISSFSVHSGAANHLGRVLTSVTRILFHLPGCCGSVIVLSWLGGYPAGVRSIVSLYQQSAITQAQGRRMVYFCVSAGTSFSISVIGMGLCRSAAFGILLFLCQTAALLLIGIFTGFCSRIREKNVSDAVIAQTTHKKHNFCNALVLSANDGARSIVSLSSFVILFSALIEPLNSLGLLRFFSMILQKIGFSSATAASFFPLCWEITAGVNFTSQIRAPLGALVFFTACGGLCVACQILAAASPLRISPIPFLFSRFSHGALTLLLFSLLKPFFLLPEPISSVFRNTGETLASAVSSVGNNPLSSALSGGFLLLFCIVFLLCSKKHRFQKNR